MRRQKTRPLALLLSLGLVLGLAGCGSMLERSYASVTPHTQFSDESDSGSVLRAETYQGLVSALLHLVEQGAEKGYQMSYTRISKEYTIIPLLESQAIFSNFPKYFPRSAGPAPARSG